MDHSLFELRGITKTFPGVTALNEVNFDLRPGEVHALLGENGAGKSTLIKIIAGAYRPDSGQLLSDGRPITLDNPRQAAEHGIAVIYQETSLYPELSVAENIFMGRHLRGRFGMIDWQAMYREAEAIFATLGIEMDVRRKVSRLTVGNRQRVEIAKALSQQARVLIMDEPTAALTASDVESLFAIVRRLREQGVGIIYISHRLEEVFELADRVTVLRDGNHVGTMDVEEATPDGLINMMVGRSLDTLFPKEEVAIGEPVLEARNLTRAGLVEGVDLTVRRGEIVGLSGLVGAGRSELAQMLFGIQPADEGTIRLDGRALAIRSPQQAMELGIAYVPEDRQHQGLILPMTVSENVSLTTLRSLCRYGFVRREEEAAAAAHSVEQLRIRTPHIYQQVSNLSGGNQQKVVIAKWLLGHPRVLILDEPTRGIDVGAKAEIHRLMSHLAAQGIGILMISSDLPEILGMSDRVLVMRAGRIVATFDAAEATPEGIIEHAMSERNGAPNGAAATPVEEGHE